MNPLAVLWLRARLLARTAMYEVRRERFYQTVEQLSHDRAAIAAMQRRLNPTSNVVPLRRSA